MKMQTFRAPTMALCMEQVKATMGDGAFIMHTRTLTVRRWMGLLRQELIEVTAGLAPTGGNRRRSPQPPPPLSGTLSDSLAGVLSGSSAGDSVAGILAAVAAAKGGPARAGGTAKPPATAVPAGGGGLAAYGSAAKATPPKPPPVPAGRADGGGPGGPGLDDSAVSKEMRDIKAMIRDLARQQQSNACPKVPDELFDHYLQLIQGQVAEEIALDIIRALPRELRPEELAQPHCVRERVAEHIERLLPACPPVVRRSGDRPHVLVLVGPTGVGKTTTLAKLAANLKVRDGHRVGMITLDTYRIAAVDQLRRYSEIIRAPLRVVSCPDELRSAVAGFSNMDYVLVDTAGRSPKDAAQLDELRDLLDAIDPDDVHLVLSSTSCQSAVELAYQKFSGVRVDKIIFTKLDEACHVGVVLNVCHKVGKALSYVTTGQDVPNDIEVGRGRVLARMILQGGPATLPAPATASSAHPSALPSTGITGW